MKAEELRIGNMLNVSLKSGQGRTLQKAINLVDIAKVLENHPSFIYEPIPLTEEWLINFGFKKDSDIVFHIHSNNNHIIYIYFEEMRDCFAMIYNGSQFCTIQYVHQLQNLYYALTGTELVLGEA